MLTVWDLIVNNLITFILVLARVAGIFTFNPIFHRNNIPNTAKTGMTVVLTVIMVPTLGQIAYQPDNLIGFLLTVLIEVLIGLILGFFVNLLMTIFIYAGEVIDMQIGLAMAKVMDPSSGASLPVFTTVFNYIFILYFFLTDGHLAYIKLFAISYETLPIADVSLNFNLTYLVVKYFSVIMTYGLKFALPILVIEMIVEIAMGIMMKAVPSIHVFVINVQLKLLVGFLFIVILTPVFSDMIEVVMDMMWENLFNLIPAMKQ